jgi:hypothetical protein
MPYGVAVELIKDGCPVPVALADAMAQGLASMHVDNARVVVTVDFVRTVAELTGRASYTTECGSGAVAAK